MLIVLTCVSDDIISKESIIVEKQTILLEYLKDWFVYDIRMFLGVWLVIVKRTLTIVNLMARAY